MSKKLIGSHNVTEFVCTDDNTIQVDSGMILSPGAKDVLRNKGITIIYEKRTPKVESLVKDTFQEKADQEDTSSLVTKVVLMLRRDFGIDDEDKIRDISILVMKKLDTN